MKTKMRVVDTGGGGVLYPYQSEVAKALSRTVKIGAGSTENIGWWKVGTLSIATFTQYYDNPSVIFVVNGIYPNQGYTNSVGTGLFELDARKNGSEWGDVTISILCGNILPTDVCCVKTDDTTVTLYYNCKFAYYSCKLTVLSDEAVLEEDPTEMFQFATEYYGTTTPANAVYGVVRNQASSLGGKEADEFVDTTSNQSVGGHKTFTRTVHFDVDNNYPMGIDGIPAGNYKDILFNDEGGDRIATIRVQNNTDDTSPNTSILIGSNGPQHTVPSGVTIIRDATRTRVEVVQPPASANNAEVATTSWVVDKGYLTAVPAASQTVLGGVKVYMDSEGYLRIDTE